MKAKLASCLLFATSMLITSTLRAESKVWVESGSVRLLRDASAGKSTSISLTAARNEWESFQIFLRSSEEVKGINVEAGDLTGPEGAVLRASDARLHREHHLELTFPSSRNEEFKAGWYPDPLIPFRHPLTGAALPADARYKAVPFDMSAEETHGFWVDVFVPKDAKAGKYSGAYRVTAGGRELAKLKVELTVWDFELPDTPTFETSMGTTARNIANYYVKRAKEGKDTEIEDLDAMEAQVSDALRRHHINATPPAELLRPKKDDNGSYYFTDEQANELRAFVDKYHVNAVSTPHPSSYVKDPEAERETLHNWLQSYDQLAAKLDRPHLTFYIYIKDEPNDEEEYRYVQKWGKAVREVESVVKSMVVEQTKTQDEEWDDLYGAVDIWCPLFPLHDEETAAQRRALGEKIWTYTALCQRKDPTPWWQIDYPLLNYRVPAWIAWRYHMSGILYWGALSYWAGVEDPWTDPKTLDRRERNRSETALYQGEGTLTYPGRAVGYDGMVSSLRLKALRDSIEDYEYLAILERAGLRAEAEKIVMPVAGSWFQWAKDPTSYDKAREKLAEMIVRRR